MILFYLILFHFIFTKNNKNKKHPRVVSLYDVFEIDVNSFATVLEYCKGTDLDEKLKRCKTLPERDVRTILLQVNIIKNDKYILYSCWTYIIFF